jgi:hypothetical protein
MGSTGDPIDQMGAKSVVSATYDLFNMGSLNMEDYAFALSDDEFDEAYQSRGFVLRYGSAP